MDLHRTVICDISYHIHTAPSVQLLHNIFANGPQFVIGLAEIGEQTQQEIVARYELLVSKEERVLIPMAQIGSHSAHQFIFHVRHNGDGRKHVSCLDLCVVFGSQGHQGEEDSCALGVAHIVNGLLSLSIRLQGVIDHSCNIKVPDLVPTEAPEVRMLRGARCVVPRIGVATPIAQPDIKAGISKQEGQTIIGTLEYPSIRATSQPMLNQHNGTDLVLVLQLVGIGYAKNAHNVAILGDNVVMLRRISMRSNAVTLKKTLAREEQTGITKELQSLTVVRRSFMLIWASGLSYSL